MYGLKYRNQSNTNYVRKPEYDSKCKKTAITSVKRPVRCPLVLVSSTI